MVFKYLWYLQAFIGVYLLSLTGTETTSGFIQVDNINCICPGDIVVYQCIACGAGATVWNGSLFDCTGTGDQIILRHRQFRDRSATGVCNNGSVITQSIGVVIDANSSLSVRECYSSQLNISMNIDMNNKTVTCIHVDTRTNGVTVIDTLTLTFKTVSLNSPKVYVAHIGITTLTFSWNQSLHSQHCVTYNIIASNCGVCPSSTTTTSAVCTDFVVNSDVCSFAIQPIVCNTSTGWKSDTVTVLLQVPDPPELVAKGVFFSSSLSLIYILINQSHEAYPFNGTNVTESLMYSYSIMYYDSTSGKNCGSAIIPLSSDSCNDDICRHIFNVSLSSCPFTSNFFITAYATNVFGDGPASNFTIDIMTISDSIIMTGETFMLHLTALFGSTTLLLLILFIITSGLLIDSKLKLQKLKRDFQNKNSFEDLDMNRQASASDSVISTQDNVACAHVCM